MLSAAEKRKLRQNAHHLKPIILVGQHGVSEGVLAETDRALGDHELIKVRFRGADRAEREEAIHAMAAQLDAEVVSTIGGTAVLYRANPDKHAKRSSP